MDKYQQKYHEYKSKYLALKNNLFMMGGMSQKVKLLYNLTLKGGGLIIHITGPQGSGKTTMGNKLKELYGDKIHVKDLDDLRGDFYNTKEDDYQKYIDKYTKEHSKKPLIFTGLDADLCLGGVEPEENDKVYDLHTKYKFYIDLPQTKILKQRFMRQVDKLQKRKEWFFNTWLEKPKMITEKIKRYIDLEGWKIQMKNCDELHKKRGYKFMHPDEILSKIKKLLNY